MRHKRISLIWTLAILWLLNGSLSPAARVMAPEPVVPTTAPTPAVAWEQTQPLKPSQVPDDLSAADRAKIQELMRQQEYARHAPSAAYLASNRGRGWRSGPGVTPPLITQPAKFTAADGAAGDRFGSFVSVGGDTVVVGVPSATVGGIVEQGAAYIFYRNQGGINAWGQVKKLTDPDLASFSMFGRSVSVSGDTLVVGTYGADAAYIFYRNQGGADNWGQVKKLIVHDSAAESGSPIIVSVDGDRLAVGVPGADVGGNQNQGAAYVFYRNQGGADNWGQVKKLTATDGAALDGFGDSVSISGEAVVVGAPYADVGGKSDQGTAYVFYRNQGGADNWGQVKKLTTADGVAEDWFGYSVSLSGEALAVGAPHADVGGKSDQGAAYVFYRNQGGADNWGQVKKLTATDGAALDGFGDPVSISGETVVVAASLASVGGNSLQGAAYVFYRNQGGADNWGQIKKLTASDGAARDFFGASVSVGGEALVIGASGADVGGNLNQGAAYAYWLAQFQLYLPLILK